jgi:hypothetical protein
LPLGLGVGGGHLAGFFLGLAQGRGVGPRLALGVFLGRALLDRLRLPLAGIGMPSRRDVGLERGQLVFGLLPRLARLLELRLRLPLGLGLGRGLLACLVLEPALLRRKGIRFAPLGERLFELFGRQAECRGAGRAGRVGEVCPPRPAPGSAAAASQRRPRIVTSLPELRLAARERPGL